MSINNKFRIVPEAYFMFFFLGCITFIVSLAELTRVYGEWLSLLLFPSAIFFGHFCGMFYAYTITVVDFILHFTKFKRYKMYQPVTWCVTDLNKDVREVYNQPTTSLFHAYLMARMTAFKRNLWDDIPRHYGIMFGIEEYKE